MKSDSKNSPSLNEAMFTATGTGNLEAVKTFIDAGGDVNYIEPSTGITILHSAIMSENKELVKLVLAEGADVNVKDKQGRIPLDYAKGLGNVEITQTLENAHKLDSFANIYQGDIQKEFSMENPMNKLSKEDKDKLRQAQAPKEAMGRLSAASINNLSGEALDQIQQAAVPINKIGGRVVSPVSVTGIDQSQNPVVTTRKFQMMTKKGNTGLSQ